MACEFDAPEGVTSHVLANAQLPTLPPGQYTILAAFVLACPRRRVLKIIARATGAKCLPAARIPPAGDALHDSHAEILARRAAVRWFYEEIGRDVAGERSTWLRRGEGAGTGEGDGGRYELEEGVRLHLYVSTPPCGDASTRFLASFQDPAIALLKDGSPLPSPSPNVALLPETAPALALARGRDGYALYGVLRTKPGRADSPRTECMSCADKIALWAVCGVQGALLAAVLKPVWIASVTIGEVGDADREVVREDCERAFGGRVRGVRDLPVGYALHEPAIHFTALPFASARTSVLVAHPGCTPKSSNESLAWHADSASPPDVLINGRKRGVAPKHAHNARFWCAPSPLPSARLGQ
ncbi:hypothetical protein FIBSPDRAFT_835570 [Athelia psychrophila]|uniref:tRNA-specific adenosine deaminase 1 n=1 Tax=Athelia psychrophila TaxID=1759441 RepID=A0A166BXZ0_9AGAM|nr:hypothetical protein FIBSPDRAFT_835570 [Fibularhizoctonia sp. CBS 109695]